MATGGPSIMKTQTFHSSFAEKMDEFVNYKRMQGYDYAAQAKALHYFDLFACKKQYLQTQLTQKIIDDYIDDTARLMPNSQYRYLAVIRVFSAYLHLFDPESSVLHEVPVKTPSLPRYYLYSKKEINDLLQYAKKLNPDGSIRPHCFYVLIGLLYVTGLRIAEALALNLGDVNIDNATLLVRKGKFGKDRYVVLQQSTCEILRNYLHRRMTYQPSGENDPFFITPLGERLNYNKVDSTFRGMLAKCQIGRDSPRSPRLHDLRHSFACNCLLKWYNEGVDVNARLPILATAMGHINIDATQIYLHVTSTLMRQAAQRFHHTFTTNL
jgi:site-specific recombinase XerD